MANVTIHCDTEGADIRYTINQEGSPENGTLYEAPFTASEGDVIRAIGMKEGMENSQVAEVTISQMEDIVVHHGRCTVNVSDWNSYSAGDDLGTFDGNFTDFMDARAQGKLFIAKVTFDLMNSGTLLTVITPTYESGYYIDNIKNINLYIGTIDGFTPLSHPIIVASNQQNDGFCYGDFSSSRYDEDVLNNMKTIKYIDLWYVD